MLARLYKVYSQATVPRRKTYIDVLYDVDFTGILSQATNTDAVAAVADNVLHEDVGAVRLEGHAVVAVVDDAVLDDNVGRAVCVPAVGVFGNVAGLAEPADRDVVEDDVGTVCNPVVVLRRVSEIQVGDRAAMQANSAKQDGAQDVDVLGIEVIPDLTVAVEDTSTVDVDISATELKERGGVLEGLVECILLPVVGVVCELDVTLDVCGRRLCQRSCTSKLEAFTQASGFSRVNSPMSMCDNFDRSNAVPIT